MSMFIVIILFCTSGLFCLSCVCSYDLAELFPSRFDWERFIFDRISPSMGVIQILILRGKLNHPVLELIFSKIFHVAS